MSRNGYACEQGKWPKAQDIYNELHELTSKPIYCVSDAAYKDIVENYFDKQCAKSKAITTEAKQYIPGGVQHNLAFNKPFPMCMVKAEGAYLYDADGNKYFDFLQAGGPTILGSNFPEVQEQAIELIKSCGPVTGLFHEAELLLAKRSINICLRAKCSVCSARVLNPSWRQSAYPVVQPKTNASSKSEAHITAGPTRWSMV